MSRIPACLLIVAVAAWVVGAAMSAGAAADAAAQDSVEEFIQGTWRIDSYLDQEKRRGRWFLEWTFAAGRFKQAGYPPLEQSGRYRVISSEGESITLELYERKGTFGSESTRLEISINRQKGQLKIGRTEPYLRVKSKT